jgi:hypothetical protein
MAVHGQQPTACTVVSNFNGTALGGNHYLWFNAIVSVKGVNSRSVQLTFVNSTITFNVQGNQQVISVPNAEIDFSPTTTTATTTFNPPSQSDPYGRYVTSVNSSANLGKDFLVGVPVLIPAGGWPGGENPVTWTGTFESNSTGLTVQWQWATAVYTQFSTDGNAIGVKPVDDNHASIYQNSDHAGTPENFKSYVVGGARGGGGSNWTGSYSATGSCPVSDIPPVLKPNACNPTSYLSVLLGQSGAVAYIPNGSWDPSATTSGVKVVSIEPPGAPTTIPTPDIVNSCSSNSTTGQTVCTANGTDVYLISGTTLTNTLSTASNGLASFSGGECHNCGVVIESNSNTAVIEMGVSSSAGGGMQFLNLNNNTFSSVEVAQNGISEDVAWDPVRNLILSPNEQGVYDIFQLGTGKEYGNTMGGVLDSAAEDCLTGIAMSTQEFSSNLVLTDLTQATYTAGTPGTWTAPSTTQYIPEWDPYDGPESGTDGIAIAAGTHLGLVVGEYPFPPSSANAIMAIHLPDASIPNTAPTLKDYAVATLPNDPDGYPFSVGCDPHTITAYVSPTTAKATGVLADYGPLTCYSGGTPQYVALVDIHGLLDAPRISGTHNVDPSYDLLANGIVTFVATH